MVRILVLLFCCCVLTPPSLAQTEIPNDSRLKTVADTKAVRIAYRSDAAPFSFVRDTERETSPLAIRSTCADSSSMRSGSNSART